MSRKMISVCVLLAVLVAGCNQQTPTEPPPTQPPPTQPPEAQPADQSETTNTDDSEQPADSAETSETAAEPTATREPVDLTKLPLGNDYVSLSDANVRWVWSCTAPNANAGGAQVIGPWVSEADGTWDLTSKVSVDGEVTWTHSLSITVEGDRRLITTNDLPNHPTGTYPISSSDDAYQYDRNPNTISAQDISFTLPAIPEIAAQPTCVQGHAGILLSGSFMFNPLDAPGRDAVAIETQDLCQGHPEKTGEYHYHSVSTCISDVEPGSGHSPLMGYAFDGFGIFGRYGENGELLTNADLDECHGHVHGIEWDGPTLEMFHYHATWEFPYVIGCTRGTLDTAALDAVRSGSGGGSAGAETGQGQQGSDTVGGATGGEPDLAAAAAVLGVTMEALQSALGSPPPDLAAAAQQLGVTEAILRAALGVP